MTSRRRLRTFAALLVGATLLTAGLASCVPSAGDSGTPTHAVTATRIRNVDQNEFSGVFGAGGCPQDWLTNLHGFNCYDEPYLMTLAFQFTIGKPDTVRTWMVHDYTGTDQGGGITTAGIICGFTDGRQSIDWGLFTLYGPKNPTQCDVPARQGRVEFTTQPFDLYEAFTTGIEIAGYVQLTMESDAWFNTGGPLRMIRSVQTIVTDTLRQLNTDVNLPHADSLTTFITAYLEEIIVGGLSGVSNYVEGLGNRDDIISIVPSLFIPATGELANLLRPLFDELRLEPFTYTFESGGVKVIDLAFPTRIGLLEPQQYTLVNEIDAGVSDPLGWLLEGGSTRYDIDYEVTRVR